MFRSHLTSSLNNKLQFLRIDEHHFIHYSLRHPFTTIPSHRSESRLQSRFTRSSDQNKPPHVVVFRSPSTYPLPPSPPQTHLPVLPKQRKHCTMLHISILHQCWSHRVNSLSQTRRANPFSLTLLFFFLFAYSRSSPAIARMFSDSHTVPCAAKFWPFLRCWNLCFSSVRCPSVRRVLSFERQCSVVSVVVAFRRVRVVASIRFGVTRARGGSVEFGEFGGAFALQGSACRVFWGGFAKFVYGVVRVPLASGCSVDVVILCWHWKGRKIEQPGWWCIQREYGTGSWCRAGVHQLVHSYLFRSAVAR